MALQFEINLKDGISAGAQRAKSSIYQLDAALKNESAILSNLQRQMGELRKAGDFTSERFNRLTSAIADQRTKVGLLRDQMRDAGGLPKAATGAGLLDSMLSRLTSTLGGAGRSLSALGPYGIAAAAGIGAVAVAAAAAGGAVAYLGKQLLDMGIAASEAKGDVTRSLELLYGSQKAAEHTYRVLNTLTQDIAISQDRVNELADNLIKAGQVNGDAMVRSIAAIGKAEAARKGAGQVLEGVITRSQQSRMFSISRSELMQVGLSYRELAKEISKGMGITVGEAELRLRTGGVQLQKGLDALTRVVDAKMGDLANKKLMTVSVQADRLRANFARLFDGVDAGPFARVLQKIANLLTDSSVTGAAIRRVLTQAFDEIGKATEYAMPYIQDFFETAILIGLKFYNSLYPIRKALKGMFGGGTEGGLASFQDKTMAFANRLGKGFQMAAGAIAWMIDNAGKLAKVVEYLVQITPGLSTAFNAASGALKLLSSQASGPEAKKLEKSGLNAASGLAYGIRAGTPAVEAAMAEMGKKAVNSFDKAMQIQSPSKVMKLRGVYMDQGLAQGVNDNAQAPVSAMTDVGAQVAAAPMQAPAPRAATGNSGRPGGGGERSIVIHFHERSIVLSGSTPAEVMAEMRAKMPEMLADVFEEAAEMSGAFEAKGAA